MKKHNLKKTALCALITAVIAVSAWVSVPTPFGINLAFTLFGVSFAGFYLGAKGGFASVSAYIGLGIAGLPVFSFFSGGIGVALGHSGGFLWGFLITAVLCGVAKDVSKKSIKFLLIILAVLLCHATGIAQYCFVTGNGLWASFLSASLPFLAKDIIIVFLAEFTAKKLKIR